MEIAQDSSSVFIGGDLKEKPIIIVMSFDDRMVVSGSVQLQQSDLKGKAVVEIKRIIGSSILIAACSCYLFAYSYSNKSFAQLNKFTVGPDCKEILDIRIKWNKIFVLDDSGSIFVRRAPVRFDIKEGTRKGRFIVKL